MSASLSRNPYFSRIAGLMLIALSSVAIWKGLQKGYSPTLFLATIIIPYAITSVLGTLQLFGLKWARIPIILLCLLGLSLNVYETLQHLNRKDIIEIAIFISVLFLVVADYASDRRTSP